MYEEIVEIIGTRIEEESRLSAVSVFLGWTDEEQAEQRGVVVGLCKALRLVEMAKDKVNNDTTNS